TTPQQMTMEGRSAGGLLMGAVLNMTPHLFKGAVAGVPFVDVVTTMLDESIPLTVGEFDEWGNPKDKTYYDYMLSYSPYDNVEAKDYPNILVTAGLNDPRVQYWEPAKWVAKLRTMKTDDNVLIMKMHMGAGHFSSSGRYDYLKDVAFDYAFILDMLGLAG
ncbi:MAG: prolyl oligopeptidase family serine peptidase, partial [Anaerolineae bacterium]|nr:prolyl oligopeptidase family serine peptidase [Anaerolineae bacterium]